MTENPFIHFFDEVRPGGLDRLGGKCQSLVALTSAGMPVPPGFAVTTEAYTTFIETAGIAKDIHEILSGLDPDDTNAVDEVSANRVCAQ